MPASLIAHRWSLALSQRNKPAYLAIADAIADDIRHGFLSLDDKLPPIRELSKALNLDYTTVARAYNEAQSRGLIFSKPGSGSFVLTRGPADATLAPSMIEMTMNMPPEPELGHLIEQFRRGMKWVSEQGNFHELMRYQDFGGTPEDRAAGLTWLESLIPHIHSEQILVTPGIQQTLGGLFANLVGAGHILCCEDMTYPGVKAIAAQLGIQLQGLPMDGDGLLPEAFEDFCQSHTVKALYLNPTIQNPCTLTIPIGRRLELIQVARRFGVKIIEDDAYGMLPMHKINPFVNLAPDIVYYITGLSKTVNAGLRIAYCVCPTSTDCRRLASTLRAGTAMASPFSIRLASRWIADGTATLALTQIRAMGQHRQKLAARYLQNFKFNAHPDGFHIWLHLPDYWSQKAFCAELLARGVAVAGADLFHVNTRVRRAEPAEANGAIDCVRLCLGGPVNDARIETALQIISEVLNFRQLQAPPA